MARVLIVGCGGRGQALARALTDEGHAVRGTTRSDTRVEAIEAAGAEAVVADPDRLGTLLPMLEGVTVVCWLMGSAEGDAAGALHAERLDGLLAKLVDSGVRGFVYEAAGAIDAGVLARGAEMTTAAGQRHAMPVATIDADPAGHAAWLAAALAGISAVLYDAS